MSNVPIASFVRRHSRCRSDRRHRGGAFTLLELLIVIGIIALLISLLLPALARTRESARQVLCLNHLKQLAAAVTSYANDNGGAFPGPAGSVIPTSTYVPSPTDWVYWMPGSIQNIGTGGIGPYLHLAYADPTTLAVLRCPSDDPNARPMAATAGTPYPFSYVINVWVSPTANQPLMPGQVRTLAQVRDPSQKILFYEENSQTLNDGAGNPEPPPLDQQVDLLAIRHDWAYHSTADGQYDTITAMGAAVPPAGVPQVPNVSGKGNVVFCDGHGEFLSRQEAHSKAHYAPDVSSPPFNNPIVP